MCSQEEWLFDCTQSLSQDAAGERAGGFSLVVFPSLRQRIQRLLPDIVSFRCEAGHDLEFGRQAIKLVIKPSKEGRELWSKVSRRHVVIREDDLGGHTLTDYSTNGTWVNGRKLQRLQDIALHHGDRISLVGESTSTRVPELGYVYLRRPDVSASFSSALTQDGLQSQREEDIVDGVVALLSAPLVYRNQQMQQAVAVQSIDYHKAHDVIWRSVKAANPSIEVAFEFATTSKFRTLLTLGRYKVLHYCGHAQHNLLAFEDEAGGVHAVFVEQLRALVAAGGEHGLDLVMVLACNSALVGQAFVDAGARHVVAINMEEEVDDAAARVFTQHFYQALAMGKSVRECFAFAREAVGTSSQVKQAWGEADKFLLLPQTSDSIHDVRIFSAPRGRRHRRTPEPPTLLSEGDILPARAEHWLGRNLDMHAVIRRLQTHRWVTVYGPAGIGKTALVVAVARFLSERTAYHGGIAFLSLEGKYSAEKFRQMLRKSIEERSAACPGSQGSAIQPSRQRAGRVLADVPWMLLVCDGCEPSGGIASEVQRICGDYPGLSILVTARKALSANAQKASGVHAHASLDEPDGLVSPERHNRRETPRKVGPANRRTRLSLTPSQSPVGSPTPLLSPPAVRCDYGPVSESTYLLPPLSARNTARMFIAKAPREISQREMSPKLTGSGERDMGHHGNLAELLSRHPVIQGLEGNPRKIIRCASLLSNRKLGQLQRENVAPTKDACKRRPSKSITSNAMSTQKRKKAVGPPRRSPRRSKRSRASSSLALSRR